VLRIWGWFASRPAKTFEEERQEEYMQPEIRTSRNSRKLALVMPWALLLVPNAIQAQNCHSTGADGAFNQPGTAHATSVSFDPVQSHLNAAGDNVFNFTSLTIGGNVTVRMLSHLMKSQRPVVFLVQGAVDIEGTLDLSGTGGSASQTVYEYRTPSEPGPGGYPGGVGARPNTRLPGAGAGPGGGEVPTNSATGCSASYVNPGPGGSGCTSSSTYGMQELIPLVGGSGGSGAWSSDPLFIGASGGAGGGAIRICSDTSITINGLLFANGGPAGASTYIAGGAINYGGGAGSGGAIHLQSPSVTIGVDAAVQAKGGVYANNAFASPGRIRIDANTLTGNRISPEPYVITPLLAGDYGGVPLPTPPTITVVSIGGQTVPVQPANTLSPPDVSINNSGSVPILVKTQGIPNGTIATFYIATDSNASPASADIVTTATVNSGNATLNVTLPTGVNRLYVRAVF
jgi:hypothetical protein